LVQLDAVDANAVDTPEYYTSDQSTASVAYSLLDLAGVVGFLSGED